MWCVHTYSVDFSSCHSASVIDGSMNISKLEEYVFVVCTNPSCLVSKLLLLSKRDVICETFFQSLLGCSCKSIDNIRL